MASILIQGSLGIVSAACWRIRLAILICLPYLVKASFLTKLQAEDMFVCDKDGIDISVPPERWGVGTYVCVNVHVRINYLLFITSGRKKLKKSQCTPLFMAAYKMRGEM